MDGTGAVIVERQLTPERPAPAAPRRGRKRYVFALLAVAALTGIGLYVHSWWVDGRFIETTDDAYIQSDMTAVASRVAGQVAEVLVADNQFVHRGDVLARLDDRDMQAALAQAAAEVASAQAEITAQQAQLALQTSTIAAAEADVASADAAVTFARSEATRYGELARSGNGSVQRAQQTESEIRTREAGSAHARAALAGARQQVAVLQAQLGRAQAALLRAQAASRQAELNLSYAAITAPADGAIGDRTVRPGQFVQPGVRLLSLVPMNGALYVVANYKETQLARMGAGETATVDVDMLGGHALRGVVDSMAPGSGSSFALLPPENATGNFTKIVQRVPVRIRLLDDDRLGQLRPGLSVTAGVDMRTAPPGKLRTLADARQ